MSTKSRTVELLFIVLILIGAVLEVVALYIDYLIIQSNYTLSLQTISFGAPPVDWEAAGLVLIFFGFIGDFLYSHT